MLMLGYNLSSYSSLMRSAGRSSIGAFTTAGERRRMAQRQAAGRALHHSRRRAEDEEPVEEAHEPAHVQGSAELSWSLAQSGAHKMPTSEELLAQHGVHRGGAERVADAGGLSRWPSPPAP